MNTGFLGHAVATVLTVYGIETCHSHSRFIIIIFTVATVLTVYGIETGKLNEYGEEICLLQQYLPFTVLKPIRIQSECF